MGADAGQLSEGEQVGVHRESLSLVELIIIRMRNADIPLMSSHKASNVRTIRSRTLSQLGQRARNPGRSDTVSTKPVGP
jgi:hypothetical protein